MNGTRNTIEKCMQRLMRLPNGDFYLVITGRGVSIQIGASLGSDLARYEIVREVAHELGITAPPSFRPLSAAGENRGIVMAADSHRGVPWDVWTPIDDVEAFTRATGQVAA